MATNFPDSPISDTAEPVDNELSDVNEDTAKSIHKKLRREADACRSYRRKLAHEWRISVDYRRGKPYASQSDEDRIAVPLDWWLTKQKQAELFSQVPEVRVNHPPQTTSPEVDPWLHAYEQRINDTLKTAGIETAMDEAMPDCINAAGIGVVMVSHEAFTEMVDMPAINLAILPPEIQAMVMQSGMLPNGQPVPMEQVPRVVDHRYVIGRLSPSDFLWPVTFNGSDFDNARWVGRSGRISWAAAVKRFKLDPSEKQKYGGSERNSLDFLSSDIEAESGNADNDEVGFDEIFYKEHEFDPEHKYFSTIHHLVFLDGHQKPVIDEPWKGQQIEELEEGGTEILGVQRFPIRVLALSYLTDEAIPPSDSAVGRAQVDELNKSRTQMMWQRKYSIPIRGVDVNRIDPTVLTTMMRGQWQHFIPVQGSAEKVITEISRSGFPQENFMFDRIIKSDYIELAGVGQEQSGRQVETKGEANVIQTNMQTRIGRERAKVSKFFCSIAEVLGGLICLNEDPASIGEGFDPKLSKTLSYSILADSTVLLDSNQRLKRLVDFVNFTAKSGYLNLEPVLKEIATLSGLDPAVAIRPPQPKPPAEPNISLRISGAEDLMNPLMLALLMPSGQAPKPEMIEAAKKLIELSLMPSVAPQMQGPGVPPMMDGGPPPVDGSTPPPPAVGEDNPQWASMPRVNQRVLDREDNGAQLP